MSTALTYSLTPGTLDVLIFDATTREAPEFASEVTKHPVEKGADITDHVRPVPVELALDVTVTDYPLSTAGRGINGDPRNPTGGGVGTEPFHGRAEVILGILQALQTSGTRCYVESGARAYTNMVITTLTPPRDKARFGALKIGIKLRQVITVASEIVPLAKVSQAKARPGKDAAHHETSDADDATKRKSWASSGVDWGLSLLTGK